MCFRGCIWLFCVSILVLNFVSCASDESVDEDISYSIQKDAKTEDLIGVWSIYKVEKDGIVADVPANLEECGRDFFIYKENGKYEEFLFQESSRCLPSKNELNWELNAGILTVSTIDLRRSDQIIVNTLSESVFVFTYSLDLNGNGEKEKYTFTAFRYVPQNEMDIYSSSFLRREESPFNEHIEFTWEKYVGYNDFVKYEIYRTEDCNLNSAVLIETIENKEQTFFIDKNPPISEEFCYFFKLFTNKGLLGQSDPRYVRTEYIIPKNVDGFNAINNQNSITLSWEKYSGYYFSHYEIRVQDQYENSNPNIETVKIIDDINITTFTDENPPYVNNPVYTVYVHNIFGGISYLNLEENIVETDFIRPELLSFDYIKFLSFDPDEQVFFFYAVNPDNSRRLIKYDYVNLTTIAEGYKLPTSYTDVEMKLITSNNGKELILEQGGDYWVYNSYDLSFKYALKPGFGLRDSFAYLHNDIWIFSDNRYVVTFRRNGSEMVQLDKKPHFTDHQGGMNYEITKIDNFNVLLSHNNEGRAIHYAIDNNGFISNKGIQEIPLLAKYNSDIVVNSFSSLLLNKKRNTIYSTADFSEVDNYIEPIFTLNFNKDGSQVFGINRQENITGVYDGYSKEIIVYDLDTKVMKNLTTKGYSLYVAEDDKGNIVSLSSGFPRDGYGDIHNNNVADMFIELIMN